MIRVSLIGPGNIKHHYRKLLKISGKKLNSEIKKISKALVDSKSELAIVPDRGICLEVAREFKKNNGKKIYGIVPKDDKKYGIKHLKKYLEEKNLIDNEINSGTWQEQLFNLCLYGDICICLGLSVGSNAELLASFYRLNKLTKFKKDPSKIDKEIKANKNIKFTYLIYLPFLKSKKLPKEIESYFKESKINLIYIKNAKHLKKELKKFN
jgi:hypothetical protein